MPGVLNSEPAAVRRCGHERPKRQAQAAKAHGSWRRGLSAAVVVGLGVSDYEEKMFMARKKGKSQPQSSSGAARAPAGQSLEKVARAVG